MRYPEIYIRAKNSTRLDVSSVGKIKADLSSWIKFPNIKKGSKQNSENETEDMSDGTKFSTAEKLVKEFSGIQMTPGEFNALCSLVQDPVDVCFFDEASRTYNAIYRCRGSVQKTFESGQSVTFNFSFEKRCTDLSLVEKERTLNEAYITGIVVDENSLPVAGVDVTCTSPAKSGYSVRSDSHGEFAIEVQFNESGSSVIHFAKGDTKDVTITDLKNTSIIEDLEVIL